MDKKNDKKDVTVTRSIAMNKKENGAVIVTKGYLIGKIIRIDAGKDVVIGRDPSQCDIVIKGDHVSRAHLIVRYNGDKEEYTLYDTSSNGTIIDEKYKLKYKTKISVKSGSKVWIGNQENEIMLG